MPSMRAALSLSSLVTLRAFKIACFSSWANGMTFPPLAREDVDAFFFDLAIVINLVFISLSCAVLPSAVFELRRCVSAPLRSYAVVLGDLDLDRCWWVRGSYLAALQWPCQYVRVRPLMH